jgi:hypothetical protein
MVAGMRARLMATLVAATVLILLAAGPAAAAVQMPSSPANTTEVNAQVLGLVQARFSTLGYPSSWSESVKCQPPKAVKKGSTFRCAVLYSEPGHHGLFDVGSVKVRVNKLQHTQAHGYAMSDRVTGSVPSYAGWLAATAPPVTTTTRPTTTTAPRVATTLPPPPTTTAPPPTTTTPPPATTPPATGCYIDPEGNCYRAGEYCPDAMHGQTIQGESGPLICTDNDGWRWEPA